MTDNVLYYIYRISSGKIYFSYENQEYVLYSPSISTRLNAELLYNNIIDDSKYEEWIDKEQLSFLLTRLGIWNTQSEKTLKQIEKSIENFKVDLYSNRNNPTRLKTIRKDLGTYKQSWFEALEKKHSMDYLSIEDYAQGKKQEYIVSKTLRYKKTKKLVFSDSENVDAFLYNQLLSALSKQYISTEMYKKIARHETWKAIWNTNKNNVFGKPPIKLSDEQRTLINISLMYDRIYEHPESPSENVIEDDDMLEGWMIYQKRQIEKQKKESSLNSVLDKHRNAQELFIVADREEASEIMSLNSMDAQRIIKNRQQIIQNADGDVNITNFPDVQMDIAKKRTGRS